MKRSFLHPALMLALLATTACSESKHAESLGKLSQPLSIGVVISQVYGGGGNSGAPYTRLRRAVQPWNELRVDLRMVGSIRIEFGHVVVRA